jgi:hypothetical protein
MKVIFNPQVGLWQVISQQNTVLMQGNIKDAIRYVKEHSN